MVKVLTWHLAEEEEPHVFFASTPSDACFLVHSSQKQPIGGKITQKLLRLFDVATVVGVLRLYFLELPGSLVNGEEYDTVKIIYSSGKRFCFSTRDCMVCGLEKYQLLDR